MVCQKGLDLSAGNEWFYVVLIIIHIIRYVIEHDGHLNVEVYLLDLKLCVYLRANEPKVVFFSRADTISKWRVKNYDHWHVESIKEKFFQLYEIPTGTETRIWHHNKTHGYELLTNFDQTLSNVDLYEGQVRHYFEGKALNINIWLQFILLEKKDSNGVWPNRAGINWCNKISLSWFFRFLWFVQFGTH